MEKYCSKNIFNILTFFFFLLKLLIEQHQQTLKFSFIYLPDTQDLTLLLTVPKLLDKLSWLCTSAIFYLYIVKHKNRIFVVLWTVFNIINVFTCPPGSYLKMHWKW